MVTDGPDIGSPRFPDAAFDSKPRELARLLFRNLVLNFLTLTVYRFWARTRLRRYMWRRTRFLGDSFEYLGTPGELLIGFLIAIAVLAPTVGLYAILTHLLAAPASDTVLTLEGFYYLLLFFLIQLAVYRARKYRFSRTTWRGVRFGLEESGIRYAFIAVGSGVLALVTLGLAYPWYRVVVVRYLLNHIRFGTTKVTFDGQAAALYRRWWLIYLPVLLSVLLFISSMNTDTLLLVLGEPRTTLELEGTSILAVSILPVLILLTLPAFYVWYRVYEFRCFAGRTRIGMTGFSSHLDVLRVLGILLLATIVLLGAFAVLSGVMIAGFFLLGPHGLAFLVVLAIFFLGLLGVLKFIVLDAALLKVICDSLEIDEPQALESVVQEDPSLGGHGEGLADALDVSGF